MFSMLIKGACGVKGKNPTRRQRKFIEKYRLNSSNWLVQKDTTQILQIVHRYTDTVKILPKNINN